jgi:hypothetical protein
MKRLLLRIFPLGITLLLFSCKTWDATQIEPKADPIEPKLPALERSITDYANAEVSTNEDEMEIFTKEVENNLTEPYGKKFGYITMSSNRLKANFGNGLTLLNILLGGAPILLGVPVGPVEHKTEITIKILNANRNLIGKYSAVGSAKNTVALYYGYSLEDANRKTRADAIKNAMQKIREQIQKEAERLNKKLKEVGPISEK